MSPDQLLNDPRYRKVLAGGGIAAVAGIAYLAKRRAAAAGAASPKATTLVSAVPTQNPPVDYNQQAIANALAGLANASGTLMEAANTLTTAPANNLAGAGASTAVPPAQAALATATSPAAQLATSSAWENTYATWQHGRENLPPTLNPFVGWGSYSSLVPAQKQQVQAFFGGH